MAEQEAERQEILMTAAEVGRLVRLSSKSVYRLASLDPTFPCARIGGARRFPRIEVLDWIARNTQGVGRRRVRR